MIGIDILVHEALERRIEQLENEKKELLAALTKFGEHLHTCDCVVDGEIPDGCEDEHDACTCGFSAAIAEHEQLRTKVAALEAELSECQKDRDWFKANDRCAMGYLSEVRNIVGGKDFPDMVKRIAEMLAALEKCKDTSIHAHLVAEKAIANVKGKP